MGKSLIPLNDRVMHNSNATLILALGYNHPELPLPNSPSLTSIQHNLFFQLETSKLKVNTE